MPRRARTYRAEYLKRTGGANARLPTAVARGHGPVPVRIARAVEKMREGRPRALPVKTQVKYRRGIAEYQKKYRGGITTGRKERRKLPTEQLAKEFLDYRGIPLAYATIRQLGTGQFEVETLR